MNKKDRVFYEYHKIGNRSAGKTLYWLHWVNVGLVVLSFIIGNYLACIITGVLECLNIILWCKARDNFCKEMERRIVHNITHENIKIYAEKKGLPFRTAVDEYVLIDAHHKRDLEQIQTEIKNFYDSV